ncbi:MAG: hypothetical protein ACLGH8_16205 [Bacteroidia bacterium]
MKKIIIPTLLLTVAAVSIHCEAESPLTINAALSDSTFVPETDSTVVDTITPADSTVVIIGDTIYYPHDSVPGVSNPGNPGVPDTTYIDSVYVPWDSVTGLRLRERK